MSDNSDDSSDYEKGTVINSKVGKPHKKTLTYCAEEQFGDNETAALRFAIDLLEDFVDGDGAQPGINDRLVHEISDLIDLVTELTDDVASLRRLFIELEDLINSNNVETLDDVERQNAESAALAVHRALTESSRPLTVDGIEERADELNLLEVEDGLEYLVNKGRVREFSKDGSYRYSIKGFEE